MARIDLNLSSNDNNPDYEDMTSRIQTHVFDQRWRQNKYTIKMLAEEFGIKESAVRRKIKEGQQLFKRVVYQPNAHYFLKRTYYMESALYYTEFLDYTQEQVVDAIIAAVPELKAEPITKETLVQFGMEVIAFDMRQYNILMRHSNIRTVEQLLNRTQEQLINIPYLSDNDFEIIMECINDWCNENQIDLSTYPVSTKRIASHDRLRDAFPELVNAPVSTLHLHARHLKPLMKKGIHSIDNLLDEPIAELLKLPGYNIQTVNHIYQALDNHTSRFPIQSNGESNTNEPFTVLPLTTRAINGINRWDVKTIEELLNIPIERVKKSRNIGEVTYKQLVDTLHTWAERENVDISKYPLLHTPPEYSYTGSITDSVNALKPNTRAKKALDKWNVKTINDLLNVPASYVETTRNIGNKTRNHLLDHLHAWAKTQDIDISEYPFIIESSDCLHDSILSLGLNERAERCLWFNWIETTDQLLNTPQSKLLTFRNLGLITLDHILETVTKWGETHYIPVETYPLFTNSERTDTDVN